MVIAVIVVVVFISLAMIVANANPAPETSIKSNPRNCFFVIVINT